MRYLVKKWKILTRHYGLVPNILWSSLLKKYRSINRMSDSHHSGTTVFILFVRVFWYKKSNCRMILVLRKYVDTVKTIIIKSTYSSAYHKVLMYLNFLSFYYHFATWYYFLLGIYFRHVGESYVRKLFNKHN